VLLSRRPEVEAFLKAPRPDVRAVVIHGRDHGLVRERAAQLAKVSTERPDDPFDTAQLTEDDVKADPPRLEAELQAISMMGGRRVVRLRLADDDGPAIRLAAEAVSRHLAGELNPEALLIVEAPSLRADSPLVKPVKDHKACVIIPCYEDDAADSGKIAREALAADGVALDGDALGAFVARLPGDRAVARQEIERLVLFLGPGSRKQASLADLEGFFGVEPEASLAEAALHAFGGRLAAAQGELRRARGEGQNGVAAVRAFGMHLQKLRRFTLAKAKSGDVKIAAKAAGVFWKQEREFGRQSAAWTPQRLSDVQARVLAADLACKRAESPDDLLAERLMFQITEDARRLGL
jgi:DNA polymerase-3 subunit delta